MKNFIKTSDKELAERLRRTGYKELKSQGKFFVFVNSDKLVFSAEDKKKVILTNKMEV